MENRIQKLESFINQYEERFNKAITGDAPKVEETAAAFAEHFIEASPAGVICGKNDEKFRAAIPKGYSFYKSIGMLSMDIVSKEITILDDLHALIKVHWKSNFLNRDQVTVSIEFDVIYFVQTMNNEHKIFAYLTGDEQAALKEHGLI